MKLWSWGANTNGQLAHGFASEQISRPLQVTTQIITGLLSDAVDEKNEVKPILQIHGGGTHVLISVTKPQDKSSTLLYLGNDTFDNGSNKPSNNSSQDGLGPANSTITTSKKDSDLQCQIQPKVISEGILSIKSLSCGWDFNLLTTESHQVFSWGSSNKYGQLGRNCASLDSQLKIEPVTEFRAVRISAGLRHAAAVDPDGQLFVWGDNTKSQLGLWSSEKSICKPTKVKVKSDGKEIPLPKFTDVKCGKSFTLALDVEGQFWGCGSNRFGQLGFNPPLVTEFIKLNLALIKEPVVQYECGWNHVLVLLRNGKLISWGRNNFNQLGRSIKTKQQSNFDVDFDPEPGYVVYIPEAITGVACGSEHNLIVGASGRAYSWGWNEHENCGMKSSRVSTSEGGVKYGEDCVIWPTVVQFPGGTGKIIQVACGAGNGFALSE